VVVDDLDVMRVPGPPSKTDSPLSVDADAVLSSTITFQLLESVRWWNAEVVECRRRIQHSELSEGNPLQVHSRSLDRLSMEEALCVLIPEALDHSTA
jgi:hypothetical protein